MQCCGLVAVLVLGNLAGDPPDDGRPVERSEFTQASTPTERGAATPERISRHLTKVGEFLEEMGERLERDKRILMRLADERAMQKQLVMKSRAEGFLLAVIGGLSLWGLIAWRRGRQPDATGPVSAEERQEMYEFARELREYCDAYEAEMELGEEEVECFLTAKSEGGV